MARQSVYGAAARKSTSLKASRALLLGMTAAVAAGCGGGGGGGGSGGGDSAAPAGEAPQASVGTFVDSRVAGINYRTETASGDVVVGDTDANGQFPLLDGEGQTVVFSIGDITLPPTPVKRVITPLDIFRAGISDPRVINLARLLQTLDEDGDPDNGIQITEATNEAAVGANIDFSSETFAEDIQLIINGSGLGERPLISQEEAVAHLEETLAGFTPEGVYFEVYGMQEGDFAFRTAGRTLIGTSEGGTVYNVSAFDRFLLYVPARSDRVFLDAVRFGGGDFMTPEFLNSIEGDEFIHREQDFNPFSANSGCSWAGGCTIVDSAGNTFTVGGEDYVEGPPDNYANASTPGEDSFYQYSTFGATSMRLILTNTPIE